MLPHEVKILKKPSQLSTSSFASIFEAASDSPDFRPLRIRKQPNLKVSVKDQGSSIQGGTDLPIVKIEFLFEPEFRLA